ncbi:MAG: hypothetical protein WBP38_15405, partial [Hyphomicrobium sp.]
DDDRAKAVDTATATRVRELIASGLPLFKNNLSQFEITQQSIEQLAELRAKYVALEQTFDAFSSYRIMIEQRANEVESQICDVAKSAADLSKSLSSKTIKIGGETKTLGYLICEAYRASKPIKSVSSAWFSSEISIERPTEDGAVSNLILSPSSDSRDDAALIGVSETTADRRAEMSRNQWIDFSLTLIKPDVSGKPDEKGVTECDRLAAEPGDPFKMVDGVAVESVQADLALEACIAALEHDPANARLKFQLGRVLSLQGADEQARGFLEAAASENYAASSVALGDLELLKDGREAAALAHYKKAVANGYLYLQERISALESLNEPNYSSGIPSSGRVTLACSYVFEQSDRNGTVDSGSSEAEISLNLNDRVAQFSDNVITFRNVPLVAANVNHEFDDQSEFIRIKVDNIGGDDNDRYLQIKKTTFELYHLQPIMLKIPGQTLHVGHLEVSGSCAPK